MAELETSDHGLIDPMSFRNAFGAFMTGVTVVTCIGPDGAPLGFTANSFTSVSLDPPLLLVCPGKHLSSFDAFATTENFAVNILAEGQERISNLFSRRNSERFSQVDWQLDGNGCPLIAGAAATFSCSTHATMDAGDHAILIGRVEAFENASVAALGYGRDGYFSLSKERRSDAVRNGVKQSLAGLVLSFGGSLLLLEKEGRLSLPTLPVNEGMGARSTLVDHLARSSINARIGPVYSAFDVPDLDQHRTYFCGLAHDKPHCPNGRLFPVVDLEPGMLNRSDEDSLVQRFRRETANNRFGLYLGNSASGEIHENEPVT